MPLANASGASLPPPSHGPGSGWFATPFQYDSCIHYFTPVYPDAIQAGACPGACPTLRHGCPTRIVTRSDRRQLRLCGPDRFERVLRDGSRSRGHASLVARVARLQRGFGHQPSDADSGALNRRVHAYAKASGISTAKAVALSQHYAFHIWDADWGPVTSKMSGHPPQAGIKFGKQANCFVHTPVGALARIADTLSEPQNSRAASAALRQLDL
jgi:hypothetical protein